MMNINDIEKKNAANGRPVGNDTKKRQMLALFAFVSLSALLSPILIEDKQDLSADNNMMLAQDSTGITTAYADGDGGWKENETIICAILSIGTIITFAIIYFGFIHERK